MIWFSIVLAVDVSSKSDQREVQCVLTPETRRSCINAGLVRPLNLDKRSSARFMRISTSILLTKSCRSKTLCCSVLLLYKISLLNWFTASLIAYWYRCVTKNMLGKYAKSLLLLRFAFIDIFRVLLLGYLSIILFIIICSCFYMYILLLLFVCSFLCVFVMISIVSLLVGTVESCSIFCPGQQLLIPNSQLKHVYCVLFVFFSPKWY